MKFLVAWFSATPFAPVNVVVKKDVLDSPDTDFNENSVPNRDVSPRLPMCKD